MTNFFTIIVPVLNQKKYISECLESIFFQDYPDFEVIIIDGNSSDGTLKILNKFKKKFRNKIRVIIDKNLSQVGAINLGIKLSKGSWITWQNADDSYFDNKAFEHFNNNIIKFPHKKIHVGNMQIINKASKLIRVLNYTTPNFKSLLYEGMTLSNQSLIWHKSLNDKLGKLIDTRVNFDYEWFLRIFQKYPDCGNYIDQIIGCYRIHKKQKTNKKSHLEIKQILDIKLKYGFNKNLYYPYIIFLKIKKLIFFIKKRKFRYIKNKFLINETN